MPRFWFLAGAISYAVLALLIFPFFIGVPFSLFLDGDAFAYSTGAVHLLQQGFYSFDGVHPMLFREPGMSFFLAVIYGLFGIDNVIAISAVQAILYFFCSYWFCFELARARSPRIGGICFFLLLTSGSVFHTIFSAYRECLALLLFLCMAALFLRGRRLPSMSVSILMGLFLGAVILTYYSFIFLLLFLPFVWRRESRSFQEFFVVLLACITMLSLWAFRNALYDGQFRIIDGSRSAVMWHVRGVQAEQIRGWQPLGCLWAEYVSRDWTGQSPVCSYNRVMHDLLPDGLQLQKDYADVASAGQAKILHHLGWYLWFSVFEVIELHLPYVGAGWSHAFNLYAIFTAALLYAGFLFGLRRLFDPLLSLFLLVILYNTAVFVLTDATPRYLLPVFFAYAVFAAVGFDALLSRFSRFR